MNMNIEKLVELWLEPITAILKICTFLHALTHGEFKAVFNVAVCLGILETFFGALVLTRLISSRVQHWSKSKTETEVLSGFAKLSSKSLCPFAVKAKLFGGGIGNRQDIQIAVKELTPRFLELTNDGRKRKLDGFIIQLPADRFATNLPQFCRSFTCLLNELIRNDPSGENCLRGAFLDEGWQFTFNNTRFFITTFAPFYDSHHPRYSRVANCAFVFFQPEYSFDNHGISGRNSRRDQVKETIRKSFRKAGSGYNIALVKQPMEALKYIKPLKASDPPVRWWEFESY